MTAIVSRSSVSLPDASDLAAVVERARALLDDGDVLAAKVLAAHAYDEAKAASVLAERFGAAEKLTAKARRLQGEALLIETRAKIAIADEWDAAQAAGLVSKGGRRSDLIRDDKKTVLTADDVGLRRKEIFESRRIAAAEKASPGIVERIIKDRVNSGLEPTRAEVKRLTGATPHRKEPATLRFRRELHQIFDASDTSYEAALALLRTARAHVRFLERVTDFGVPVDRGIPLGEIYSDAELLSFDREGDE